MRRHVTLYLGRAEQRAMTRCPAGTPRGRWVRTLAGQLAGWDESAWRHFLQRLAPRPTPARDRLTVSLPEDLATTLDRFRGGITLSDVLRTALLQAARVDYLPVPMLPLPQSGGRGSGAQLREVVPRPQERTQPQRPARVRTRRLKVEAADTELTEQLRDSMAEGSLDPTNCAEDVREALTKLSDWADDPDSDDGLAVFIGVRHRGSHCELSRLKDPAGAVSALERWWAQHPSVGLKATGFGARRAPAVIAVEVKRG